MILPQWIVRDATLLLSLLTLGVGVLSCTQGDGNSNQGSAPGPQTSKVHPTDRNIPSPAEAADVLRRTTDTVKSKPLRTFVERLRGAERAYTIGKKSGTRSEMIGKVMDVTARPPTGIYLLDGRYNEVRAYDRRGTLLASFGEPGRGPGQFEAPQSLIRTGDTLVVADRMNRVDLLVRKEDTLEQLQRFTLLNGPRDLCVLNGKLFAYIESLSRKSIIHKYSMEGNLESSFGDMYKASNEFLKEGMSTGKLACNKVTERVVAMMNRVPVVKGYENSGNLKWQTKLADFESMEITKEVQDGRTRVSYDPGGTYYDALYNLEAGLGPFVLLQVARVTKKARKAGQKYKIIHTYAINSETGKGAYVGNSIPPVFEMTKTSIYCGVNKPYPRAEVYRLPSP